MAFRIWISVRNYWHWSREFEMLKVYRPIDSRCLVLSGKNQKRYFKESHTLEVHTAKLCHSKNITSFKKRFEKRFLEIALGLTLGWSLSYIRSTKKAVHLPFGGGSIWALHSLDPGDVSSNLEDAHPTPWKVQGNNQRPMGDKIFSFLRNRHVPN